jgi:hypothetical protein
MYTATVTADRMTAAVGTLAIYLEILRDFSRVTFYSPLEGFLIL